MRATLPLTREEVHAAQVEQVKRFADLRVVDVEDRRF